MDSTPPLHRLQTTPSANAQPTNTETTHAEKKVAQVLLDNISLPKTKPLTGQATQVTTQHTDAQTALLPAALSRLVTLLQHHKSLAVTVSQTEVIDSQAKDLLKTINPDVFNRLQASTKQSGQQTFYLVKLADALTQSPLLTTVSTTPLKQGSTIELSLRHQQIVIRPSAEQITAQTNATLKTVIAQQKPTVHLFQLANSLQNIPSKLQPALFSQEANSALKVINQFTITPQASPKLLVPLVTKAIQNSGVLTEFRLASQQPITQDIRKALQTLSQSPMVKETVGKTLSNAITNHSINPSPLNNRAITNTTMPASNESSIDKQSLAPLQQLLGLLPDNSHNNRGMLKETLQQQLKDAVQQMQERIQFNQLKSVVNDTVSTEGQLSRNSALHVDLPLRWGDQILPLQLAIHEQTEKETQENIEQDKKHNKPSKKEKCWHVVLSFDLPDGNTLDTQLNVNNDSISATFWSESEDLQQKINASLDDLRHRLLDSGLTVEELQCFHGTGPAKKFSLDYHLIDIET